MKRNRHPLMYLLRIPVLLLVSICLIVVGSLLDTWLFSGSEAVGHGVPVFTMLFFAVAVIVFLVGVIAAVAKMIKAFRNRKHSQP